MGGKPIVVSGKFRNPNQMKAFLRLEREEWREKDYMRNLDDARAVRNFIRKHGEEKQWF